jgi:hypothetical protein
MATNNSINSTSPIGVASGGTGAATLTAHSLLLGEGTSAVTALGAATNGQIPIGSTGADPVLATLTQGTGITITNGAGSITIASSGSGISTITGNSGGALSGSNISIVTAGATAKFAGASTTETLDFGIDNLALGSALPSLSSGVHNVAYGSGALVAVTTSNSNTAIGYQALPAVDTSGHGGGNTAVGALTLTNATGGSNVAVGFGAGGGITTGANNIFIGAQSTNYTSSESSNILMNSSGTAAESHACRIGGGTGTGTAQLNKTFISGIQTITVTGTAVLVSTADQLGVAASSKKFKKDIKDMGTDTDFIYKLRPVTFVWDQTSNEGLRDAPTTRQFGLIAEEVVSIQPELVGHDKNGDPLNVHYDRLIPMLLNEIHRLEKRVRALELK